MSRRLARRAEPIAVLVLLLAMLVQAGLSTGRVSLTYDEHTHLPCGYTYWAERDFRLGRGHPPLHKLVAALPLLGMDLAMAESRAIFADAPAYGESWHQYDFGEVFLLVDNARKFDAVVRAGRLAMLLVFPPILALVVYFWSRRLFGRAGALLSLTLVVFNPDVLGHGSLVASDVPMAAFYGASIFAFWSIARRPSLPRLVTLGVCLGAALAVRYSNLLLGPVLCLLVAVALLDRSVRRAPASWLRPFGEGPLAERLRHVAASGIVVLALAAAVLWASYLFARSPLEYSKGFPLVYGLSTQGYEPFLRGEYRPGGFWSYYLVALGLKLPLPVLALLGWAVVHGWRRRRDWQPLTAASLVLPPILLLAAMTIATVQIGHRYVFGVYPFLFVGVGCLGSHLRKLADGWSLRGAAAAVLVALAVVAGLRAYPFYLSYHNAIVPSQLAFFDYLDDSNNDWHHGWREVARLQERGELGTVAVYVRELHRRRLLPYGIRHVAFHAFDPAAPVPAPGTYLFSASEHARARKFHREAGDHVALLEDYEPSRVIAGCVLCVEVPPAPEPPAPGPLEVRETTFADGSRSRWHVYRDAAGAEVRHGPYTVWFADGEQQEEGSMSHGRLHGRYVRWHRNGQQAEVGTMWRGALHGTSVAWDEDGRRVGVWESFEGQRVRAGT